MPTTMRRIREKVPSLRDVNADDPPNPAELAQGNLRSRFRPLARSRTSAVLASMDYLGQLAVRARYHYTDDEAQAILSALRGKLEELTEAFTRGTGNKPTFQWPDEGKR